MAINHNTIKRVTDAKNGKTGKVERDIVCVDPDAVFAGYTNDVTAQAIGARLVDYKNCCAIARETVDFNARSLRRRRSIAMSGRLQLHRYMGSSFA
jgi:hypothetical protein